MSHCPPSDCELQCAFVILLLQRYRTSEALSGLSLSIHLNSTLQFKKTLFHSTNEHFQSTINTALHSNDING